MMVVLKKKKERDKVCTLLLYCTKTHRARRVRRVTYCACISPFFIDKVCIVQHRRQLISLRRSQTATQHHIRVARLQRAGGKQSGASAHCLLPLCMIINSHRTA